jgi:hypothetical protein
MITIEAFLRGRWVPYETFDDAKTVFLWLQGPWDMASNQVGGFIDLTVRVRDGNKKLWEGIMGVDPLPHDQLHQFDTQEEQ